jgi:hypothetical protein
MQFAFRRAYLQLSESRVREKEQGGGLGEAPHIA